MRSFKIVLILTLMLSRVAIGQSTDDRLCPPLTGTIHESYGSGDCAGNNFRTYDLSYVYPGMTLYYNSQSGSNLLDFGKSFTFSEVNFLSFASSRQYFIAGDGTYIELEYRASGPFAGKYVAKDRNRLSDYFVKDNANQITQYEMEGTVYRYTRAFGDVFRLSSITSRIGATTSVLTGTGATQNIQYSDGLVTVTRSGVNTTIQKSGTSNWVKLTRDSSNRLTTILYTDGTKYQFAYKGNTTLMSSESLITSSGSVVTKFLYDNQSRLVNVVAQNGTSIRYIRDIAQKTAKAILPTGQITTSTFDTNGHVVSMKTSVITKPNIVISEETFSYDANGKFLWKTFPDGDKTIKIEAKYLASDLTVPVGYRKFEGTRLVEEFDQNTSAFTRQSYADTLKNGAGVVLSKVEYTYENGTYPYLLKSVAIKEGAGKGSKQSFSYTGNETKVESFDTNGTKVSTSISKGDLPWKQTDHTAPATQQLTEMVFDNKKQLTSVKQNGVEVSKFAYDTSGRRNYFKDSSGTERVVRYDSAGLIASEDLIKPGGTVTKTYVREFYPGNQNKLRKLTTTTTYPNESATEVREFDESSRPIKVSRNGVVVWER